MRVVGDLAKLIDSAQHRWYRLRVLAEGCSVPVGQGGDRLAAFLVIETFNLWASFARSLFLSSCMSAKTTSGHRVVLSAHSFATAEDALRFAIREIRGRNPSQPERRDEPAWYKTRHIARLFSDTGASNLGQIQAAVSYQTAFFDEVPTVRNFFAHRNEETASRVQQIARNQRISPRLRPSEVVSSVAPGRPQTLLADWLDDLRIVMRLSCQ